MEYQKIITLLDSKPNHPSKFKTNTWVEINDESRGKCNEDNQIRFIIIIIIIIINSLF